MFCKLIYLLTLKTFYSKSDYHDNEILQDRKHRFNVSGYHETNEMNGKGQQNCRNYSVEFVHGCMLVCVSGFIVNSRKLNVLLELKYKTMGGVVMMCSSKYCIVISI